MKRVQHQEETDGQTNRMGERRSSFGEEMPKQENVHKQNQNCFSWLKEGVKNAIGRSGSKGSREDFCQSRTLEEG